MANSYSDSTGVLRFAGPVNATPVIKALFGPFELDPTHPGGNQAYIASISESSWTHWEAIVDSIEGELEALGIAAPELTDEDSAIEVLLSLLGAKFGCSNAVQGFIAGVDFDGRADIHELFDLAMLFDDGHGLASVSVETGWHCDKPRLFEFGGAGEHYSKHFRGHTSSSMPLGVGGEVDTAMSEGDVQRAGRALASQALKVLDWAVDEQLRSSARSSLVASLDEDQEVPITLGEREFDLFVGIGTAWEDEAPQWMHVRLNQALLSMVHRHQRLVEQHGLSEVQSWHTPWWQGEHAMACDSLVVDRSRFYWSAYPKHGDHAVESVQISWPQLKAAIDDATATGAGVIRYGIDDDDVWLDCLEALKDSRAA